MKVIILTGISHKHQTGLYNAVIDRVKLLKAKNIKIELYSILEHDSTIIKIIKKILRRDFNYVSFPEEEYNSNGIKIKYIHISKNVGIMLCQLFFPNLFYFKIAKMIYLRTNSFNIIHSHWLFPHGLIAYHLSKLSSSPYVLSGHGSDVHTYSKNFFKRKLIQETLNEASHIFFVSQELESIYKKTFNHTMTPTSVSYNGIFIPKNDICPLQKKSDQHINIGYIGNLAKIKGADRLTPIYKELKKLNSIFELHIIGDGPLYNKLRQELNYSNVHFYGKLSRSDVFDSIQKFNLIIMPSRQEGLGIVALESLSLGVRVVGNKVGGLIDVLGPLDLTYPYSTENVKGFVQFCLNALNKNLPINIDAHIKKFDPKINIIKEINIYNNLINGR
jgi:glycosyltransferase involved in cell wall biosynthesis